MVIRVFESEHSFYALQWTLDHFFASHSQSLFKLVVVQVEDAQFEIMEDDPRVAMCDALERFHASILVLGSHGYGLIKREILGSVSDHCAHHAHCSVMIVKRPPKTTHSCSFLCSETKVIHFL